MFTVIVHLSYSVTIERTSETVSGLPTSKNYKVVATVWSISSHGRAQGAREWDITFLCMVPDGLLVDSKSSADDSEWDRRVMFHPQDPGSGVALLAEGQTRIERVVSQSQFEEVGVVADHFWVWQRSRTKCR
jgi:hypothetical protein